jgi:hypothetical protein
MCVEMSDSLLKQILSEIIILTETNEYRYHCENQLNSLGFLITPTNTGSSIIQHQSIPLRGELHFSIFNSRVGKIILECDSETYKDIKSALQSNSYLQHVKFLGGFINQYTGLRIIFSKNFIEGTKVTFFKK